MVVMPAANDRTKAMRAQAAEFARSGRFTTWVEVEKALIQMGMVEARIEFSLSKTQTSIDRVCRIAQGARARGITYEQALKEEQDMLYAFRSDTLSHV
jgi:hypothetical protein